MTNDDHDAVVALLERKLDAAAPRDPDPVRTVLRRARVRRRRVVAGTCAAVLAVTGLGAAGVLTTGQGTSRTLTPAEATNIRQLSEWSGETVQFHGLTLPVPEGWTVRRSSESDGGECRTGVPRTLWLFDVPPDQQWLGDCRGATTAEQMWAVTQDQAGGSWGGRNPLTLDPSGQPVLMPDLRPPSRLYTGLDFPWLDVSVTTANLSDDRTLSLLSAVRAEPVPAHDGLRLPDAVSYVGYQRFGGDTRKAPAPNGQADPEVVSRILATATPDATLRCVPTVGSVLYLQRADGRPPLLPVVFDTTGQCDQVLDFTGGLATLDADGLRTLAEQVHAPTE